LQKKAEIQQKLDFNLKDMGINKFSDDGTGRKISFKATEIRKPQSYTTYSSKLEDHQKDINIYTGSNPPGTHNTEVRPPMVKGDSQLGLIDNQYAI